MQGLVIKNTGSWYHVKTDDNKTVHCKIRGNFRLKDIQSTNPVVVGDYVVIEMNPEGTAFITEIVDRKNYIVRRSSNLSKQSHILAANIDQCILFVTVNYPETSTVFIDRFLASAEAYRVPITLLFNKIDAFDEADLSYVDGLIHLYTSIGYSCMKSSLVTGEGVEELNALLNNKVSLFSGHSGVGKSSFINLLIPDLELKVGDISAYHNTGMHTTTYSEMYELPQGGYIIDTPGIKGFGTFNMEKEEISHFFPEIFKTAKNCRFNNCIHIHEPGCAVVEAVKKHYISESRYHSYLSMMEDDTDEKYRAAF